jgi:hypothetical protein
MIGVWLPGLPAVGESLFVKPVGFIYPLSGEGVNELTHFPTSLSIGNAVQKFVYPLSRGGVEKKRIKSPAGKHFRFSIRLHPAVPACQRGGGGK